MIPSEDAGLPGKPFPSEVWRHLTEQRETILARWVDRLADRAEPGGAETETPIEFHRRGLDSLLTLFLDDLHAGDLRRVLEYLETLIVKGFLADLPVTRLVEMFQILADLLAQEVRARFGEAEALAAPVVEAIRMATDAAALASCRCFEQRAARLGGRFEELFEKAKLINLVLDAAGRIVRLNAIAAQALSADAVSLVGTNFARFVDPAHLTAYTRMLGYALQGDPQIGDLAVRFPGREPMWLAATMSPVVAEGKIAGIRVVATDVTAERQLQQRLRRSEEKYRRLIENANDAIFLFRVEDGRVADSNFQATELSGFRRQELAEMHIPDLFPGARAIELIQETIAEGSSKFEGMTLRARDGREIVTEVSSNVIEYGETKVIQSIVRDMTHRRQLESKLQERTREIVETRARLGAALDEIRRIEGALVVEGAVAPFIESLTWRLARVASRLEAVRGDLAGLRAGPDDVFASGPNAETSDGLRTQIELVERNLEQCEEDLSELRRLGRDLVPPAARAPTRAAVRINDVVRRMLELVTVDPRREITVRMEAGEVPELYMDPDLAAQVIYLAMRGLLALTDDRGRLSVRTLARGTHVLVELSDNARSLDHAEVRRILDPYTSARLREQGVVPDLKRCRRLLSWVGGTLAVTPGGSRGNTVTMEFPVEAVETARDAAAGERRYDLLVVDKTSP